MPGDFFDMIDDDCDDEGFFIEKPDTVSSSPMMGIKKGSRVERGEKGFPVCRNCKTELNYRCEDGIWKYEPYCAHCGVRLIEEDEQSDIVRCKNCNAYTETGPGTGVCPAHGGVAEYDGCTMGDRREENINQCAAVLGVNPNRLMELARADTDGRVVLLNEYPAKNRYEAAEYLSDWLKEATFEDASVGFYAINSDTADVISGIIQALNDGLTVAKEKQVNTIERIR